MDSEVITLSAEKNLDDDFELDIRISYPSGEDSLISVTHAGMSFFSLWQDSLLHYPNSYGR